MDEYCFTTVPYRSNHSDFYLNRYSQLPTVFLADSRPTTLANHEWASHAILCGTFFFEVTLESVTLSKRLSACLDRTHVPTISECSLLQQFSEIVCTNQRHSTSALSVLVSCYLCVFYLFVYLFIILFIIGVTYLFIDSYLFRHCVSKNVHILFLCRVISVKNQSKNNFGCTQY